MTITSLPVRAVLPRRGAVALTRQPRLSSIARGRRVLIHSLGLLWLLDAALQFQPFMFSTAFPDQIIAPAGHGSPQFVSAPVSWAAQLMATHIVVFNALFAGVQLAIAVGLFLPRTVRPALAASIAWSLMVWWLGEGLGGTLAGPVSPLMGLPGAVILYALLALLVWPRRPRPHRTSRQDTSLASHGAFGASGARLLWLLLWAAFAFEALRPAARTRTGLHDLIAGMADGEPALIASTNNGVARVIAGNGTPYSIVLALACALIAASVFTARTRRLGVVTAIIVALIVWVVGEDFGEIATGTATDPNSGLPLVLFAACYWPWAIQDGPRRPLNQPSPTGRRTPPPERNRTNVTPTGAVSQAFAETDDSLTPSAGN